MRPTVAQLASRRPALGALLGALPREGHFGHESSFGAEFGDEGEFGWEEPTVEQYGMQPGAGAWNAAQMGDPSFSLPQALHGDFAQIGVNRDAFRGLVGQDVRRGGQIQHLRSHLTEAQRKLMQYEHLQERRDERAAEHAMQLDPNHGQRLKLGVYSFGLTQAITIGVPVALFMTDSPATTIRTKRVVMNAPTVGFATVSTLLIANVAVTVGGAEDAFAYSATSFSNGVDYPTLPPSQKATMSGGYTGFAPTPIYNGQPFSFSVRFSGVSTIAGGA
jgi:hypothetical protein